MTLVVHSIAGLAPESGGPARTVTSLTDSLAEEENISIILVSQRRSGNVVVGAEKGSRVDRRIIDSESSLALSAGLPFRRQLDDVICAHRPALIHDHGIWHPANHHAARAARRFGIPLLIQTRGMLEPWALDYHAWKKRAALLLYQRGDLESAKLFFATAQQEVESIRRLGLNQPVAMIPNGVKLPDLAHQGNPDQQIFSVDSPANLVFMSRIHPKKGLLNLVEAWGRVRPENWRLRLAGPDERGHLAEVMQQVRVLGLEASVEYVGEVEGASKAVLLESADLFVLPSFSENFAVVVAEALAYGVPVITTHGTPWAGLEKYGCGWWVEPTADALTKAFQEALSMDSTGLRTMGLRGREYAREFDWQHIAQQTVDTYRWILGQGSKPACVVLD